MTKYVIWEICVLSSYFAHEYCMLTLQRILSWLT